MKKMPQLLFALFISITVIAQTKRPIGPADADRIKGVGGMQVSPDGQWVAYVVTSIDTMKDKRHSEIWMMSWDGKQQLQLTGGDDASSPKWSPDGKYISFVSGLPRVGEDKDDDNSEIYLLDRRGGEAKKITHVKGDIDDYCWSPDATKLLLTVRDQDFSDTSKTKKRKPFVIDRYHFKQDYMGFLDSTASHLYLFTIATKKMDTLTKGIYSEGAASLSPDGSQITFMSNRTGTPDKNENYEIYVMDAKAGAAMKQLTNWPGVDENPMWSPDGNYIAYLQSSSNENFTMYGQNYLAVIPKEGGEPKLLSKSTDRGVGDLHWAKDSKTIAVLFEDDRQSNIVTFDIATGQMKKITQGDKDYTSLEYNKPMDAWVTTMSTPQWPVEMYAEEHGVERKMTNIQDSFMAPLQLATVKGFKAPTKDGSTVSGILYLPPNAPQGQKLPLVLFIHGGPVGQDAFGFDLSRQIYACAGYAVAGVNYRGSSGRGVDYIRAIYGDWGNKEEVDIIGAADYLIKQGIADENRMGIAGWSYGGISTDYTIATDQRFKAAVSGAGSALQLSMWGYDEYITQYQTELGAPWQNPEKWIKLSDSVRHISIKV